MADNNLHRRRAPTPHKLLCLQNERRQSLFSFVFSHVHVRCRVSQHLRLLCSHDFPNDSQRLVTLHRPYQQASKWSCTIILAQKQQTPFYSLYCRKDVLLSRKMTERHSFVLFQFAACPIERDRTHRNLPVLLHSGGVIVDSRSLAYWRLKKTLSLLTVPRTRNPQCSKSAL